MVDWRSIQAVLSRDPARRGLVSSHAAIEILAHTSLESAARSLASNPQTVAIATGFAVVGPSRPAAETDGPPGALYLARTLLELGATPLLIVDSYSRAVVQTGCRLAGIDPQRVIEPPASLTKAEFDSWVEDLFRSQGPELTHLVSIERVGPSHTLASLATQARPTDPPWAEFDEYLPPSHRDRCHNMHGEVIDPHSPPLFRLFESAPRQQPSCVTIGMGDGGNEIGMGRLPWELLQQAIPNQLGGRIACRIPTDHLLIAGVSNWAAYALSLAVAALSDRLDVVIPLDLDYERRLIQTLVVESGAVDGVTRLREPTVDGLPLETYLQALAGLRHTFHLPE